MSTPIPGPRPLPIIGNLLEVSPDAQSASFSRLADIYGPFYKLTMGGKDQYIVANHKIYNELCDEKHFGKSVSGGLFQMRNALHDGLFTAFRGEHAWGVAHRVLMPVFGPVRIRDMFDEMHEISTQLVMKWARFGPDYQINATDDFTRLTLDTITLCAMETRFNSFYREDMHPFPKAMVNVLAESGRRSTRPAIVNRMMRGTERQYFEDIELMHSIAMGIVEDKKAHPSGKRNLLTAMLDGVDPKTGEKMSDASIANNMITLLVAGHETTSGFLSFILYRLMSNPDVQRNAQKEVDEVIGTGPVKVEHVSKLPYLTAVMRETIRLNPPAPSGAFSPLPTPGDEPVIVGGEYHVPKDATLRVILDKIHVDPEVWGEDATEFKPERCLEENFAKLPRNAWKPFGNGERSCIGRAFAWQEAILVLALLLQTFDFKFDDPGYKLQIKQTLTLKPHNMFMHATLRKGVELETLEQKLTGGGSVVAPGKADHDVEKEGQAATRTPLAVYWGGNAGTCQSLAHAMEKSGPGNGFNMEIHDLDSAANNLPRDKPVVIITSSYEGQPPDNAKHFIDYLEGLKEDKALEGVKYAVFGCGNHDWQSTFQRIPTLCDELLEKAGATRLAKRGAADAAIDDIFDTFDTWEESVFWPALKKAVGGANASPAEQDLGLDAEILTSWRSSHLKQPVCEAVIVKNEIISKTGHAQRRHIEFDLASDLTYRAGDYLAVLPINPTETTRRVMVRFGLPWDSFIDIKSKQTTLPNDGPISVNDILKAYVEISQPATRRNIKRLIETATEDQEKEALEKLTGDSFAGEITSKRVSVLDLLEKYPSTAITFQEYLSLLPQLRLRQYSISSSPLAHPGRCSITIGVLDAAALSGSNHRFYGVASNYLAKVQPGDHVQVAVKESHASFHLPAQIEETPIIMVAAGTGIAPFRGFIQERAVQIEAGRKLAPALLFYGCLDAEDVPYVDEFTQWVAMGAVDFRPAFSRTPKESAGAKYAQDRFWQDRADVRELFAQGAKVYVCGHGRVGDGLKWKAIDMRKEHLTGTGQDFKEEDVEKWFGDLRNDRYMADVFG